MSTALVWAHLVISIILLVAGLYILHHSGESLRKLKEGEDGTEEERIETAKAILKQQYFKYFAYFELLAALVMFCLFSYYKF